MYELLLMMMIRMMMVMLLLLLMMMMMRRSPKRCSLDLKDGEEEGPRWPTCDIVVWDPRLHESFPVVCCS